MRTAWLFAFTSAVLGCGGPTLADLETGAVSLRLTATSSQPEVAAPGPGAGGLGVTRVFVSSSLLSLLPCKKEAAAVALAPRGYDLLLEPAPSEYVSTAVTELCGLRLDIDPLTQNGSEGVPDGASLLVEGTDATGASSFRLASGRSWSLLLESPTGASFGDRPLLLAFDLSTWLAGLPLAQEGADVALDVLESRVEAALGLYIDADDDGIVDDEERAAVASVGSEP